MQSVIRILFVLALCMQTSLSIGQLDAEHRLEIMNVVDRSNAYFNSCVDRDGYQRVNAWEGFEELFHPDAKLVNDILVLNQMDEKLEIDLSEDAIEKLEVEEIGFVELDYLQTWRHVYSELPTFEVTIHHIELDKSKSSATCWVSKSMISPGRFVGTREGRLEKLAEHIQQSYPLNMTYGLVKDEFGWLIKNVEWASGQSIPWHQFVKITDGEGGGDEGWEMSHWKWNEASGQKPSVRVIEEGLYHVISPVPNISLAYNDPSYQGQTNCATAQQVSLFDWLTASGQSDDFMCTQMQFAPATVRLETQLVTTPLSLLSWADGVGELSKWNGSGAEFGIWVCLDKEPNSNKGWRIDIGGGRASGVLDQELYQFEESTTDTDGDAYVRRVQLAAVNQSVQSSWASIGVGYEASNRSTVRPKMWNGWRALFAAGVVLPQASLVEYDSAISGRYQQYGNVEISEGVYDFGTYSLSETVSTDLSLRWSSEILSTCRIESEDRTGWALTGAAGLCIQGATRAAESLTADQAPNLLATSTSSVHLRPALRLGISKLLIPSFDSNCSNQP